MAVPLCTDAPLRGVCHGALVQRLRQGVQALAVCQTALVRGLRTEALVQGLRHRPQAQGT